MITGIIYFNAPELYIPNYIAGIEKAYSLEFNSDGTIILLCCCEKLHKKQLINILEDINEFLRGISI